MEIVFYIIITFLLGAACFLIGWKTAVHPDIITNERELKAKKELELQISTEKEKIQSLKKEQEKLQDQYSNTQQYIADAEKNAERIYNSKMGELDLKYEQKEKELKEEIERKKEVADQEIQSKQDIFNEKLKKSEEDFIKQKEELTQEIGKTKEELNSLKATKIAAIEAARKEELIHNNQEDYCLQIPIEERNDISILESVQKRITKPRAISSVIWSAYFQPIAKKQFPKILGHDDVCGVYKITNQETGECYIGQSTDCRKRWNNHCRAGCGIDTPQGNKLYKAMQEYGLENFSFELLLECSPQELNEKEKYFINLYSSDTIGYNSNKGVG